MISISEKRAPTNMWVDVHYKHQGQSRRYNLELPQGIKALEGMQLEFNLTHFEKGRHFEIFTEADSEIELLSMELMGSLNYGKELKSVFVNGYQSATTSRDRSPGERISSINWFARMLQMHRYGDTHVYKYPEKRGQFHGFGYAYARYSDRLLFVGTLDESNGFTIIHADVHNNIFRLVKDLEGLKLQARRCLMSIVLLEGDESEVFDRYVALRREYSAQASVPHSQPPVSRIHPLGRPAAAWSSEHFSSVEENSIRHNLSAIRGKKIPLDYFIIDHGWQRRLGDWQPGAAFSSGMSSLAAEIRGSGLIPGIWYAPFVTGPDVPAIKRSWLLKDSNGHVRPVGRISPSGSYYYALNILLPEVRERITQIIRRLRDEWGYSLIKLDLLHVSAMYPRDGKSRGEIMSEAIDFLVDLKGDAEYLACSVPLQCVFDKVEYCRVAASSARWWDKNTSLYFRERPSMLNNLRSTVGRRQLDNRFFSNETDSYRIHQRPRRGISPSRRYTQMLLHILLGKMTTISENITDFRSTEQRLYLSQFPLPEICVDEVVESRRTVTINYRAGNRNYIFLANLSDHQRRFKLPAGRYFQSRLPRQAPDHFSGPCTVEILPGRSRNLLILQDDFFCGSTGHLMPGCEIVSIQNHISENRSDWSVIAGPQNRIPFKIWLRCTAAAKVRINDKVARIKKLSDGFYAAISTIVPASTTGSGGNNV